MASTDCKRNSEFITKALATQTYCNGIQYDGPPSTVDTVSLTPCDNLCYRTLQAQLASLSSQKKYAVVTNLEWCDFKGVACPHPPLPAAEVIITYERLTRVLDYKFATHLASTEHRTPYDELYVRLPLPLLIVASLIKRHTCSLPSALLNTPRYNRPTYIL